ncbi:hypothetical protein M218_31560 [Burkholderia pseudomallei MSHR338]|uniref:Uncharacterized protein n=2 Tax=pseudomallei group TaxID=111527 RepID=A2RYR2_BURM9|nr:hypothetical protein BMASAVP1_0727 [Burkholderia mallei SAVP1]ABN00204.1 hypothetical protein BMA10229_1023 [Burkholderia mallei NCTC 10229]ABN95523.1 hypothetical protein BURPS1106A_A0720 [Burkholderia pseudomallei 1106a]ABO03587.1 hypothetical protein BMA10247_A1997 [Burkholderia mallei NCTC 10247]AFR18695.1 hypothetical protein BPC006_II0764 [Burkholderia pseudomallei BPC006]EBA45746.1 hypothetical protein BURPS305_7731 [Burkholderia pseudomallei 305]EDK53313.1 hypothetical protein BMAF
MTVDKVLVVVTTTKIKTIATNTPTTLIIEVWNMNTLPFRQ